MRLLGIVPFVIIVIGHGFILHSNLRASVKRKAFRWSIVLFACSLLFVLLIEMEDVSLLIFALPVLAWLVYAFIRYTKICEWCGHAVDSSLPFRDKKICPRCGSELR